MWELFGERNQYKSSNIFFLFPLHLCSVILGFAYIIIPRESIYSAASNALSCFWFCQLCCFCIQQKFNVFLPLTLFFVFSLVIWITECEIMSLDLCWSQCSDIYIESLFTVFGYAITVLLKILHTVAVYTILVDLHLISN